MTIISTSLQQYKSLEAKKLKQQEAPIRPSFKGSSYSSNGYMSLQPTSMTCQNGYNAQCKWTGTTLSTPEDLVFVNGKRDVEKENSLHQQKEALIKSGRVKRPRPGDIHMYNNLTFMCPEVPAGFEKVKPQIQTYSDYKVFFPNAPKIKAPGWEDGPVTLSKQGMTEAISNKSSTKAKLIAKVVLALTAIGLGIKLGLPAIQERLPQVQPPPIEPVPEVIQEN